MKTKSDGTWSYRKEKVDWSQIGSSGETCRAEVGDMVEDKKQDLAKADPRLEV